MKKLKKLSLKQMEGEMAMLGSDEQRNVVGGSGYFQMANGMVVNYDGYCVYTDNNGNQAVFDGVNVLGCTACDSEAAYQWNGTIKVGADWGSNFNLNDLKHEYGHYLQEQEYGSLVYGSIAIGSAWDLLTTDGSNHSQLPYEEDATQRGNNYWNEYYGNY